MLQKYSINVASDTVLDWGTFHPSEGLHISYSTVFNYMVSAYLLLYTHIGNIPKIIDLSSRSFDNRLSKLFGWFLFY